MSNHTTGPQRGAGLRVTRERIEAILRDDWYPANHTVLNICRDWLDMRDRLAAAERVVEAVKAECPTCLDEALAAYDATTAQDGAGRTGDAAHE